MKLGIFDHLDRRGDPLERFYSDRLEMARAAEAVGFYAYHIAEHHATPLGMAPSPNLFLAALARETSRIRFGPLVYLLPLYHPVRLIEEICMLDHLSGGRLDVGVGRGISRYEVSGYGVDPLESREMFVEALEVLRAGLTHDRLDHKGRWYTVPGAPMELRPLQQPYPPMWYGVSSEDGVRFAADHGMHFVTLGDNDRVARLVGAFPALWEAAKDAPARAGSPVTEPLAGVGRHVFCAETDAEADRLARPAYAHWYDSVTALWRAHGAAPITGMLIGDFDEACRLGTVVVGAPATVRETLLAQARDIGFNYLVCQPAFGSLTHEQEMRSLALFAAEVMPALLAA